MAQVAELWQWWNYYYSLVVQWGMKLCFTAVVQACGEARCLQPSNTQVTPEWVPTSDSAHSWRLYCTASLGHQTASTMTCYLTQSHYSDTEPTSRCPILIMPSIRLGRDKCQFYCHEAWRCLCTGAHVFACDVTWSAPPCLDVGLQDTGPFSKPIRNIYFILIE